MTKKSFDERLSSILTPKALEHEIYTLDDAKEAVRIIRACTSIEILAKAIAAAIARARAGER